MKNEGYISNTQNLLSNETSLKIAKEVSWKYHNFLEMHHKSTNKKLKNAINRLKYATKTYKKVLFSGNKYPFFSL